ncbi:MAG: hypothetical protein ACRD1T_00295 [Acidimicrobiia bacterium]
MLGVLLSQGCGVGSDGDGAKSGKEASAASRAADLGAPTSVDSLPLGGFFSAEATSRGFIVQAEQRALAVCMGEKGFKYRPLPPPIPEEELTGRVGLADANAAASSGYLRKSVLQAEAQPQERDFVPRDPAERDAYTSALLGTPAAVKGARETKDALEKKYGIKVESFPERLPSGCQAEIRDRVYGGTPNYVEYWFLRSVLEGLGIDATQAVRASQRKEALDRSWAACMGAKGFTDASDPIRYAVRQWPEPRPGKEEIVTAMADVECKEQTGYAASVLELHSREQGRLLDGKLGVLERYGELREQVEARAREALGF